MIYAVKHNQVNRALYKDNEDSLTAAIFERLMYLPNEMFQFILEQALFDPIPNLDLRKLESIEFWPHWNPAGTGNSLFVEPDIFIRTTCADIIIEAKRYDKRQQLKSQWKNQIAAYKNVYEEDARELIFIALGGLHTSEQEKVSDLTIYKCSWSGILKAAKEIKYKMEVSFDLSSQSAANFRIINDLILCFALYGFSTAEWFERFLPQQKIKESILNFLNENLWKN